MARLVFAATFAASLITARALRIPPSLVAWSPALPDGSHYPTVTPENVALAIAEPDPLVVPLSWEPRIFLIKNFLSEEECDHVMSIATPQLTRSTVVDGHGGGVVDPIRNSAGMFVRRRSDSIITRIENRLANISMLPVSHQEDMQVLRYEPGQHYLPHTDYFSTPVEKSESNGLQRIATILMYLNGYGVDFEGGETVFPLVGESPEQATWDNVSRCTKGNLAVRPNKGDAVLFWSLKPDGSEDPGSTHGSCDVTTGVKFSAPIWMRQAPFHPQSLPPDGPQVCRDEVEACDDWAEQGECVRNAGFMSEKCRKACGVC
jgi:prolyl 4-hydroxylase